MKDISKKIDALISAYNKVVKGIDDAAINNSERAYGGIVRAGKGTLLENMTAEMVRIAWIDLLGQDESRLEINKKKMPIKIKKGYENRIKDPKVKEYIRTHRDELTYKFGTDVQVFIDGCLVLPIECKAYTENAMLKRILFDATLMNEIANTQTYYLIQLESMLGGDYCDLNPITLGSPATHVLISHTNVDLEIITLLEGERRVDRPIHKKEFFKELKPREVDYAIHIFANGLEPYM